MSLPHIVVGILGMAPPVSNTGSLVSEKDYTPARSRRLALYPEGSNVTRSIRPSLGSSRIVAHISRLYDVLGGKTV